jgi:membrane protein YdbS with pleckstrin-like domain
MSDPARVVQAEIGSTAVLLIAAAIVVLRWRSLAQESPDIVAAVGTWVLVALFTVLLALLMLRWALEKGAPGA